MIKDWQELASNDPVQLKRWQEYFRDRLAYWGMPTGRINGVVALDLDVKADRSGFKSVQENKLEVPATLCQNTINGGRHYLYRHPMNGKDFTNRVNMFPGIDRRCDGGYVCLYNLDNTPLAQAPDWLLSDPVYEPPEGSGETAIISPAIAEPRFKDSIQAILKATEGERNHTLNREGFKIAQLVASGAVPYEYAARQLEQAAKSIGLEPREIIGTINSALKGGHNKPITSPFGEPKAVISIPPPPPSIQQRAMDWVPPYFTLNDLLDTTKLRKPQLFENWSTEDIHITIADGGTGKTTLKLYESVCLALGESFLGFQCLSPGKTLYITGEDTASKLGAMIGKIAKQMGVIDDQNKLNKLLSSIVVKKDPDLCLIYKDKQGFLHANNTALETILKAVDEIKPRMIVFDPISSFWGSEAALNDMAKAVAKFMMALQEKSNACVEMINHIGKASSNQKDMSQFAGRGGTGLPSHARVNRVLRPLDEEEFYQVTGQALEQGESAMLCNVAKFSDGSPLYNKPFAIRRKGFLFERIVLPSKSEIKAKTSESDIERIAAFINEQKEAGVMVTKTFIEAFFANEADKISKERIKQALSIMEFVGHKGKILKAELNPDATSRDKILVFKDRDGRD